jgi:hypothetical protein
VTIISRELQGRVSMTRFGPCLVVALLFLALPLAGCGVDSRAVDEAYTQGYSDGAASVEDSLMSAQTSYDRGYADGLAAAEKEADSELCQSCYGLGFAEGFQAGSQAGAADTSDPTESA